MMHYALYQRNTQRFSFCLIYTTFAFLYKRMIKLIERSERTALQGKNVHLTYNQLLLEISHYTALLECKPNQRIVIFSENRPEWIAALFSIWKKGAIVVPIDVMSSQDDLDYIIGDSN